MTVSLASALQDEERSKCNFVEIDFLEVLIVIELISCGLSVS